MEKYLTRYIVETDYEDRGSFSTLRDAARAAGPEDYILEATYRLVRSKILKAPEPKVIPELKRGDWLVLTGEHVRRFYIDAELLALSDDERKDPFAHRAMLFARYADYMPFSEVDDITSVSLQCKKFGVRLTGDVDSTTEWRVFSSRKEALGFLKKNYNIDYTAEASSL
jgi:hypothetical protein